MDNTVRQNLLRIQEEIAPYTPNIIAVTKYFDESAMIDDMFSANFTFLQVWLIFCNIVSFRACFLVFLPHT